MDQILLVVVCVAALLVVAGLAVYFSRQQAASLRDLADRLQAGGLAEYKSLTAKPEPPDQQPPSMDPFLDRAAARGFDLKDPKHIAEWNLAHTRMDVLNQQFIDRFGKPPIPMQPLPDPPEAS